MWPIGFSRKDLLNIPITCNAICLTIERDRFKVVFGILQKHQGNF